MNDDNTPRRSRPTQFSRPTQLIGRRYLRTSIFGLAILVAATQGRAAATKPVNLLRQASATVVRSSVAGPRSLRPLFDGRTATRFTAENGRSLEVVFSFADKAVTPHELEVLLAVPKPNGTAAATFDVLSASDSATTGYQSLRSGVLKSLDKPQRFAFKPIAARWIMLRITPLRSSGNLSIAEIVVRGRAGLPAAKYRFEQSPARALALLGKSIKVSITADETALFADARDGKLDRFSFAEAVLIASGITDRGKRAVYLRHIDRLEAEARKALADANTPTQKGRRLLKWLHAGPLKAGYRPHQTRLSTVLDEKTFNCVSSATLYNVLGRRLGLDLRTIEVPQHAFSILYLGSRHFDVETTVKSGFAPARNSAVLEAVRRTKGSRFIADRDPAHRRELRELGLAGLIYYNRAVDYSKRKQSGQALIAYFCALSLDREAADAAKNASAVFNNWSGDLSTAGRHEEALKVIALARTLAPRDATIANNLGYLAQEWLRQVYQKQGVKKALAVVKTLQDNFPKADRVDHAVSRFATRIIHEQSRKGQYAAALQLVDQTDSLIGTKSSKRLRSSIYDRWARSFWQTKRQYVKGLDIYRKGLKELPGDSLLTQNAVYVWNRRGMAHIKTKNWPKAIAAYKTALKDFPTNSVLQSNLKYCEAQSRRVS
ncbi:MAG: tetratricopeptide repeat protein [Planctomycetaceae bacterium]